MVFFYGTLFSVRLTTPSTLRESIDISFTSTERHSLSQYIDAKKCEAFHTL